MANGRSAFMIASSFASLVCSLAGQCVFMWINELAMNANTADSTIGSQSACMPFIPVMTASKEVREPAGWEWGHAKSGSTIVLPGACVNTGLPVSALARRPSPGQTVPRPLPNGVCMRTTRFTPLLLALLVPMAAHPQTAGKLNKYGNPPTVSPSPTMAAITVRDLQIRLYQFSDDSMQGRQVGRIGNMKGTNYIAVEVKRLGLQPAGDNGTFFQVLPFHLH